MTPELETERLILRPLQLSDAERTQEIFPQWELVKYLHSQAIWPYPEGQATISYRDKILPAIERGEEWHWTLRLKCSPEQHIGAISLRKKEDSNRGFWLGLPWQGQGLMTEAVVAINDYWFDTLGFNVLRAHKAIANVASRRISEKTGMRVVATLDRDYLSGRLPSETWEITAEEWHEKRKTFHLTPIISRIDVRELCADDVIAIPAIDGGAAWHGGESKWSKYWEEHRQGTRVCLVASRDGHLAGYGSLLWHSQYPLFSAVGIPEINDMVVAEGHRGQGIATAMIAAFEERVRSDGKSTIGIGVGLYADYGSAQRLYARLGYLPDGRGITWNNQPVAPNSSVRVDDELILWLTKHLV